MSPVSFLGRVGGEAMPPVITYSAHVGVNHRWTPVALEDDVVAVTGGFASCREPMFCRTMPSLLPDGRTLHFAKVHMHDKWFSCMVSGDTVVGRGMDNVKVLETLRVKVIFAHAREGSAVLADTALAAAALEDTPHADAGSGVADLFAPLRIPN